MGPLGHSSRNGQQSLTPSWKCRSTVAKPGSASTPHAWALATVYLTIPAGSAGVGRL